MGRDTEADRAVRHHGLRSLRHRDYYATMVSGFALLPFALPFLAILVPGVVLLTGPGPTVIMLGFTLLSACFLIPALAAWLRIRPELAAIRAAAARRVGGRRARRAVRRVVLRDVWCCMWDRQARQRRPFLTER